MRTRNLLLGLLALLVAFTIFTPPTLRVKAANSGLKTVLVECELTAAGTGTCTGDQIGNAQIVDVAGGEPGWETTNAGLSTLDTTPTRSRVEPAGSQGRAAPETLWLPLLQRLRMRFT